MESNQLTLDSNRRASTEYMPTSDSLFSHRFAKYQLVKKVLDSERNLLQPSKDDIKPKVVRNNQWKFFAFFFIFFLIVLLRIFFNGPFSNILRGLFNSTKASLLIEDRSNQKPLFYFLLHITFVLTLSLAIYSLFEGYNLLGGVDDYRVFLRICMVVFVVYLIKFLVHFIMGLVFDIYSTVSQYLFSVVTINSLLCLVLLPVLLIIFYTPHINWHPFLTKAVIGIMLLSISFRYFLGIFQMLRSYHFPLLYLFLYLCTFEIFPWLFIVKYIKISFLNG